MEFKDKIKNLRILKGLTQEEAGASIGLTAQSIGHYESGRRTPSQKSLKKMAELYGVSISELLEEQPLEKENRNDLVYDMLAYLDKKGLLDKSKKFDELDKETQEIIISVINKAISQLKNE